MEETKEWLMVVELMDCLDDMKDSEVEFIQKLYGGTRKGLFDLQGGLDPYEPFLDQMEGLSEGKNQEKWLNAIYERVCNEDDEAAEDIYEE